MKKEDQSAAQDSELLPCPFCGSPAKHESGFLPMESVSFAYCSNSACPLHDIHVGFSKSEWNTRSPQPPITKDAPAPAQDGVELVRQIRQVASNTDNWQGIKDLLNRAADYIASPPLQPTPPAQPVIERLIPDPLGYYNCTHKDCGRFEGPHSIECRAMADGACYWHQYGNTQSAQPNEDKS